METQGSKISVVQILDQELRNRSKNNPAYSLRAFAKFLEVSPALLSLILNGKAPVSRKMAEKVCAKFILSEEVKASLRAQINVRETKKLDPEKILASELEDLGFKQWYHYRAIPFIAERSAISVNAEQLAEGLGLTKSRARSTLHLLRRCGFISSVDPHQPKLGYVMVPQIPKSLIEGASNIGDQKQRLVSDTKRAGQVLSKNPALVKISSMSFKMTDEDYKMVESQLGEFAKKLCLNIESRAAQSSKVFTLNLQLFPEG